MMTDPILERDPRLGLVVQRLVTAYQPESIARTHLRASLPGTVLREGRLLHAA